MTVFEERSAGYISSRNALFILDPIISHNDGLGRARVELALRTSYQSPCRAMMLNHNYTTDLSVHVFNLFSQTSISAIVANISFLPSNSSPLVSQPPTFQVGRYSLLRLHSGAFEPPTSLYSSSSSCAPSGVSVSGIGEAAAETSESAPRELP